MKIKRLISVRLFKVLKKKNSGIFFRQPETFFHYGFDFDGGVAFAFQAQTIIANPLIILLIAIPLLAQTYGIFALAHVLAKWLKLPHEISAPACLIGTSNFFELAVAISLFGLHSGAALATVVGVLVEVPVMLSLVWWLNRQVK